MKYDLNNIEIKIYYESCAEFEQARSLCLEENNWLRENYTEKNLVVEEHSGFGVVYQKSTGKPMLMAGVFSDSRYPSNVAKMVNRLYTFPEFRTNRNNIYDGFRVADCLIKELMAVNSFEIYLITMQNRPHRGGKRWWDVWCDAMNTASNNMWTVGTGYIQTCPWPVQKCWQNYVYHETRPGAYAEWNPVIIDDAQWTTMEPGQ